MEPYPGLACLVLVMAAAMGTEGIRVKRQDCDQVQRDHTACTGRAHKEYQAVWAKGDDGRPDWVARKTCNYLEASIDVCGDSLLVGGCNTVEQVTKEKDQQLSVRLKQIKSYLNSWDSAKCPPVKKYLQRLGLLPDDSPQDQCSMVTSNHNACIDRAYKEYQAAWAQGDDGRPSWVARRTCNYMKASIDVCGDEDLASGCMTLEEVNKRKDYQIAASLKQVKETIGIGIEKKDEWNSSKCPPVRAYLWRLGLVPEMQMAPETTTQSAGLFTEMDFSGMTTQSTVETGETVEAEEEGEDWFFAFLSYWLAGLTGESEKFTKAWAAFLEAWESGS